MKVQVYRGIFSIVLSVAAFAGLEQSAEIRRLIDLRQLARAEELVVRHLASAGRSAEWILLLAEIRLDQARHTESLQLLDGARRLGDFSAPNRLLAGLNYVALQRLDLAEPEIRAAVELDPDNARAHYYLGRLLYTKNLFAEAIESTKKAIALDPGMVRAYDNLGLCYEGTQRYGEAEQAYLEGIRVQRMSGVKIEWPALNLGVMLLQDGRYARARTFLEEALKINPASAEAHFRLGSLLEHEKDLDGALGRYRQAVGLDSRLAPAYYRAALIYRSRGMQKEAEEQFQAFLKYRKPSR